MTTGTQAPRKTTRASLSGEVSDFLIELGSAFQKVGMYPEGHPALGPAIEAVKSRLAPVLAASRVLAVGIGREELVVGGVATDASHPLFRNLAARLYRHEIGAITFAEGVTGEEIAEVLRLVSTDPERTGRVLGQEPEAVLRGRPHIRLEPARFTELRLKARGSLSAKERRSEERSLWRSLADAAVSVGQAGEADADEPTGTRRPSEAVLEVTRLFPGAGGGEAAGPLDGHADGDAADVQTLDPDELARLLSEHSDDVEVDRALGRQMASIARSLATLDPEMESDLRDRFTRLLASLDPATLQRLLSMGGDEGARRRFLLDAVRGVGADAVLTLIRASSANSSSDISRWMLRLLTKMAGHVEEGSRAMQARARTALRDQVSSLLADWDLDNPNPEDYETALGRLALNSLGRGGGSDMRASLEPERVAQISLEIGVAGEALAGAVDRLVASGRAPDLVQWLDAAPGNGAANPAALHAWDRLAEPSVVRRLVEEDEPDFDALDRILPLAGLSAAEPLLDRLATAQGISLRRSMFDRVAALGPEAGPLAAQRLQDPERTPWYVLRNMLALMGALSRWPADFDPGRFGAHANPQVRFEALKLCMRLSDRRPAAVLQALGDEVGRIRALGVVEAERGAPPGAEPRLAGVALDLEEDREVRLPAIRALARLGTDGARDALVEVVDLKRRLLGRSAVEPTPEKLAAARALLEGWPEDPAVREIRAAVEAAKLAGGTP